MAKFKTGEINNPNGRPRGSGHRQKIFNALVMPHKNALIEKALSMAKDGDPQMLKILLERILPVKPMDEPVFFEFPKNKPLHESLKEFGEIILRAVAEGEITTIQAKNLFDSLKHYREEVAYDLMLTKLKEVEDRFNNLSNK